ncbi:hypothetical protein D3C72_405570 [compost metagenome]
MKLSSIGFAAGWCIIAFAFIGSKARADDWLFLSCPPDDGKPIDVLAGTNFSVRRTATDEIEFRNFDAARHIWVQQRCDRPDFKCTYTPTIIEWVWDQTIGNDVPFRKVTLRIDRVDGAFAVTEFYYHSDGASPNSKQQGLCRRSEDPALQAPATAF